jgi:hypothetical protein
LNELSSEFIVLRFLGTPVVGDYKYGRQAHQNWKPLPMLQTIDEKMLKKSLFLLGFQWVVEALQRSSFSCIYIASR